MLTKILLYLIRAYQRLSFFFAPTCRFYPTCSQYAYLATQRYGAARGIWLSLGRILRCHPFTPGGYDPPYEGLWKKESF